MSREAIFRPGRNSVIAEYTVAFVSNLFSEGIYPNDWCSQQTSDISTYGPGSDGIVEGETLRIGDLMYARRADYNSNYSQGLQNGVCVGENVSSVPDIALVGPTYEIAEDSICTLMTHGVYPGARCDSGASVGQSLVEDVSSGDSLAQDWSAQEGFDNHVGVALTVHTAYTRNVTARNNVVAFVRCGF